MKIKLTEKFSIKRKGDVIDVSEVTAEMLIAEGKAKAVAGNAKSEAKELKIEKGGKVKDAEKVAEEPKGEPQGEDAENITIE